MRTFYIALLIWNIAVMIIYGIDKWFAKKGKRRIKERTLILIAFLLGGTGSMFGMVLFNHKTSKIKFRLLIPLASILCLMFVLFIIK